MSLSPDSMLASREAELSRAEAEFNAQEARLLEQVARASSEADSLGQRLAQLRDATTQTLAERPGDEEARTAGARLQSASVQLESLADARERALAARQEALEARRNASEELQAAARALQHLTQRLRQEAAEAEAGLERSNEAAEKARRAQEAAERAAREAAEKAQREAARQAARQAPQHTPASQAEAFVPPAGRAAEPRRVHMRTAVDMRSDSNFFTGFSSNIREGGIFVATVQTLPQGTPVEVDFTLGNRPLKAQGVVAWVRDFSYNRPELMPGLGVRFTELPPEVASAISGFVSSREPLFFPA